ncbi:MAG: hypothetical protein DMF63_06380, partial [Acidobacteria bacterium]
KRLANRIIVVCQKCSPSWEDIFERELGGSGGLKRICEERIFFRVLFRVIRVFRGLGLRWLNFDSASDETEPRNTLTTRKRTLKRNPP